MSLDKQIKIVLDEFGIKMVNDTRSNLQKKLDARTKTHNGKIVRSRLWTSIKEKENFKDGNIGISIEMNDYWDIVDKGRKNASVSKEGQMSIQKWAETRGFAEKIRLSDLKDRQKKQSENKTNRKKKTLTKMPFDRAKKVAAFLISRSLKNKVLEPTNFFTEVLNDGRVKELEERLTKIIRTDIIINISNGINS